MVVTFEPMPREYLQPEDPPARLTSLRERWRILRRWPLDYLCVLRFDEALRNLSAQDFAQVLAQQLGARSVVVGHDFRFGRQGAATRRGARRGREHARLRGRGAAGGDAGGRAHQQQRRARRARGAGTSRAPRAGSDGPGRCAGAWWRAERLGRKLGFPDRQPAAQAPARRRSPGVFAVRVHGIAGAALAGVASLGTRPTVAGTEALLEAHVFDFAGRPLRSRDRGGVRGEAAR